MGDDTHVYSTRKSNTFLAAKVLPVADATMSRAEIIGSCLPWEHCFFLS